MKMPEKLDEKLLAPCGINCLVCYRYCAGARKPCPGCRYDGEGKPEHCRRCHIRDCAREKGWSTVFCALNILAEGCGRWNGAIVPATRFI